MKMRPITLTMSSRAPLALSTSAAPRPGVPGGKLTGRIRRGWRSMNTSASR